MTIKELYDKIETMIDDSRADPLRALYKLFSSVSKQTMLEFQYRWDGWDSKKSFEEFVEAQNKQLKSCIALELSSIGKTVREADGITELTWETKLVF